MKAAATTVFLGAVLLDAAGFSPIHAQEPAEGGLQAVSMEASRTSRRVLPFDPMAFERPRAVWEELPGTQWWAARLVSVVVGMGLLASERAGPVAALAETLMREGELSYGLRFDIGPGRDGAGLKVQLKEVGGGPYVNVLLTW